MKTTIFKISFIFLFLSLIGPGCEKEDDEWIEINPSNQTTGTANQLDIIFSEDNNCLLNFQGDTVLHTVFVPTTFMGMDNCNNIPEIDFGAYTLIAGKIMVASISDHISAITLTSNRAKDGYKLNVSIDKCDGCYAAIGYLYFWRLYPKLNSEYNFELVVTEK